jgi:hypothetical protein
MIAKVLDLYAGLAGCCVNTREAFVKVREALVNAHEAFVKAREALVNAREALVKARDVLPEVSHCVKNFSLHRV